MNRWSTGSVGSRRFGVLVLLVGLAAGAILVTAEGPSRGPIPASAPIPSDGTLFLPGAAHVTGAADTNWRTDLEVFNPDPSALAQFEVSLLVKDAANTSPATLPFHLMGGRSVRYDDILYSLFGFTGSAALRVTTSAGLVLVSSRTFNLTDEGTYGQYIGAVLEERAIHYGEEARIIQLSQSSSNDTGYRTNVGFVNARTTNTVVQVDLYRWDGFFLGTRNYNLDPLTFTQKDRIFRNVTQEDLTDGYVVVRTISPDGAFFAYASVVDNRTGDPIYIPATIVDDGAAPSPTPTPTWTVTPTTTTPPVTPTPTMTATPTQPSASVNLRPYQPQGWDGPLVVSGQPGTSTSGGLVGGQTTYVDWALINEGPDDVVFPAGEGIVRLDYDGSPLVRWTSSNDYVVEAGFYVYVEDYAINDLPAGSHTMVMTGDPDDVIDETNEGDNSFSFTGNWAASKIAGTIPAERTEGATSLRQAPMSEIYDAALRPRSPAERAAKLSLAVANAARNPSTASSLKSLEPIYIPATAHVAGAAGTNWRTDLELHNPDTVQGQYEIALLLRNQANPSPQTVIYSVAPGRCLRLNDVLYGLFGFEGGASLRITPLSGSLIVTSRTYNLTDQGTYGQFIGGIPESAAIGYGDEGVLIQLTHHAGNSSGFRTNVGFVSTVDFPIWVQADLYRGDGTLVGSRTYDLQPFMYRQVDRIFGQVTQNNVADGYVTVTSSTPGGRFHAYASVVDNATGDPVYIPAVLADGGGGPPQSPTPTGTPPVTPTMTPTVPPGIPMDPRTTGTDIFEWLGTFGTSPTRPTLEELVAQYQDLGLDGVLDLFVSTNLDVAEAIPNGIALDFGTGYVLDDGTVFSGQIRMTFNELVNNPTRIEVDAHMTQEHLQVDGTFPLVDDLTGGARLDVDPVGHVAGNFTFNAEDTLPKSIGQESINGDVEVDTEICPNYPIGGSATVIRGEDEHVFSFTDSCDGTFGYLGPGSTGDVSFRLRWDGPQDLDIYVTEPNGETIYFGNSTSATGGQLDVDSNSACSGPDPNPTENVFWPVGQAPNGTYEFWAQLWSDCGASSTPNFTFFVFEGSEVVREIPGTINGGTSPHYTHDF